MNAEEFEKVFEAQVQRCRDILVLKAKEYAKEDRLHNFKQVAHLKGEDPVAAIVGLMAKHTVSIYDMCMSGDIFPPEVWDEKITDHLNYLFLLKGLIEE